ncbi:MAG: TatD family hydrolase [Odoribacter sp.]
MEQEYINIHTHHPGHGINIFDPCLGEMPSPENGKILYSMGIHPMYINENTAEKLADIEQAAAQRHIVAVGEAGLDRNAPVAMEIQIDWFCRQADIAARYQLPLIIHGVRAIPELIAAYKKCPSPKGWIIHGFNNRREILDDLLRHGFYISVGRQLLQPESNIFRLLPAIPLSRLFIETDHSDFTIEEIYRAVAQRLGMDIETLQQIIHANFAQLFHC